MVAEGMHNQQPVEQSESITATQQFLFPFLLKDGKIEAFIKRLQQGDFTFFSVEDKEQQDQYYGRMKVSHANLETYFMPNIEPILFPDSIHDREGLRRFSKNMDREYSFVSPHLTTTFVIASIDIIICPFHIGLMNIRVHFPEDLATNDILHFGDLFRMLTINEEEAFNVKVGLNEDSLYSVKDLIYHELLQEFTEYIDNRSADSTTYFGSLPFFIDERMYVISFLPLNEEIEITAKDLYRIGELNGYDANGEAYVGASNPDYIQRYYEEKVYDRWGDTTYYVTSDTHFSCVTKKKGGLGKQLSQQMYGEHFYGLLLFFYYKLVLLKLSHDYSKVEVEKDMRKVELLMIMITTFTSKYYLPEVNSTSAGKEIFRDVKRIFRIEKLYEDVKHSLAILYQNQDKWDGKRLNYLIQILTIYTVISGIFGMNLVIEELGTGLTFSILKTYSIFEWLVLAVTLSGILISLALGFFFIKRFFDEKKSRKRRMF
ncbi:hypothetical protein CWR48_15190 [Oceanobacillus arenosus]|uniref:Group-specific protein n=1 Tax=Oceanobacillus arenosus TaxID=1229153 RepID=A0A3D8PLJ3_9BACI|nr:hypothetical protein [Oceanobacillus arenosus]RDW16950.1 hypothetical protein CWR48_15190 [Oceanobacillus arenosus]